MSRRRLKNWLEAYLEYTARSESPERFHKWTGIATIAGALRRRVYLDMELFKWYPNFFLFFVAPPGVSAKSTSANLGMDLLKKLEHIKFGPSSITWQRLIKSLEESREDIKIGGSDINAEYEPMCAITCVASELGTLVDPSNREMIDVLVDLWDGKQGSWKKETLHSGEFHVQNPWINIIGCTTPGWIADNCSEYFVKGGFASRVLFVYGDKKRNLVPYPHLEYDRIKRKKLEEDLVHDLEIISHYQGEFQLTSDAIEWGIQWYINHHQNPNPALRGEAFQGYMSRKQTHIHKVAMVLAVTYKEELIITKEDLVQAEKEVTSLEADMNLVFQHMSQEKEAGHSRLLLDIISYAGSISKADLYRGVMNRLTVASFEAALQALQLAGVVYQEQEGNSVMVKMRRSANQSA